MKSPLRNAISPFHNAEWKVHEAIKGVQKQVCGSGHIRPKYKLLVV